MPLEEFMNMMNSLNIKNSRSESIGKRAFVKALKNSKYQMKTKVKRNQGVRNTYYYITK